MKIEKELAPIKSISIILPARNEEESIGPILDKINEVSAELPSYDFETIVVVDDLADLTVPVAQKKGANVYVNEHGKGKGNALYCGFLKAKGDMFLILDSDGSHDPHDIPKFITAINGGHGLVIGSRVLGGSSDHDVIRLFANALFTVMVSLLFGVTVMDTLHGYKGFRRDVVFGYKPKAKGFDIEVEITAQAIRKGYSVFEISTHETKRSGGKMKSHAVRDGFYLLKACLFEGLKYRLAKLIGR